MKKISLFILSVLLPLLSSAANSTLSIEPLTIGTGETKTMFIDLSNPDQQVTMVEFRMQLPQGLSVATGDNVLDIAGRTNWQKHTLYSNEKDGLIHVMLASPTNALISGTSGALISVRLTASSTFSGGTITLKNQKIGSPDMTVSKPADYSYTVQTPSTEAEPYVVFNNGTLTFYCDNQRSSRAGETYDLNDMDINYGTPGWMNHGKSITKAVFDASFANARPTTTYNWFLNCSNLIELQGLNYLNTSEVTNMSSMFDYCYSLTNLDVSNFNTTKVTKMRRLFYNCYNLTALDVSNFNTSNVTDMESMFNSCSGLSFLDVSHFNTEKVTNMSGMFNKCSSLISLDISNFNTANVTNMFCMFNICRNLTSLDVSKFNTEKVTNMSSIFKNCSKLSNLTLGNKFVTNEESNCANAFYDCSSLSTITFTGDIPSSINSKFFEGVGSAENPATLDVPAEYRDHYAAKMNGNQFFGGYFKLSGGEEPGTDIISFADPVVKRICVSNWDTNGDGELSKAEAAAVTDIGMVFYGNNDITSFDEFQYFTRVEIIPEYAFAYCLNLLSIKLPNSITNVKYCAINYCPKLTSISFPDNYGFTLAKASIAGCEALTTVYLPKNAMIPGGNPFSGCSGLTAIEVDENNIFYKSVDGVIYSKNGESVLAYPSGKKQSEYEVLSGTRYIGYDAFNWCLNLHKVTLPSSIEIIRYEAFIHCQKLIAINIPQSVKSIEGCAFAWCYKLGAITIPNSVTSIGDEAFWYCNSLPSITIPASVTFIGSAAFGSCYGLNSIVVESGNPVYDSRNNCNAIIETGSNKLISGCKNTVIPNSVNSIGDLAFRNCMEMTSITIPNSVTSIGNQAFGFCKELKIITIPESVVSIGNEAFYACSALKEIRSLISKPFAINDNVFTVFAENGNDKEFTSATLYVPKGTKGLYQQTDGWKNFQNIVEMSDEPGPGKQGDVNGDGELNSTDLVMMVNMIMGNTEKTDAADLNGDGVLNSTDLVMLVNMIMGQ